MARKAKLTDRPLAPDPTPSRASADPWARLYAAVVLHAILDLQSANRDFTRAVDAAAWLFDKGDDIAGALDLAPGFNFRSWVAMGCPRPPKIKGVLHGN